MKKIFIIIICMFILAGCSQNYINENTTESAIESENEVKNEITYEEAYNFIKDSEERIIENNKNAYNKYKESAAEKIIYSDEYSELYCSYWSALEKICGNNDDRFNKTKMRFGLDFTSDLIKSKLLETYDSSGADAFFSEYSRMYQEEVFPKVKKKWDSGTE